MYLQYIKAALDAYKRNVMPILASTLLMFFAMFALVVIALAPLGFTVIKSLAQGVADQSTIMSTLMASMPTLGFAAIFILLAVIVSISLTAGLTRVYAEALRGKTSYKSMIDTAKEKWLTIIGANIIIAVVISLVVVATALLSVSLGMLGTALLFGVIALLVVFFSYVNQAIVLNNLGAVQSVKFSYAFAKQNFKDTVLILIIFFAANFILEYALSWAGTVLNVFVLGPLTVIALTALYLDRIKMHSGTKTKKRRKR